MNKERKYKKELRSIEKLLGKTWEPRKMNEWDSNSPRENVFYVLDHCEKAKKIIDDSKVKEMHEKPHAYLAIHDGFNTRGLPEGAYRDNLDIVQKVALNSFFDLFTRYSPNGSLEGTVNSVLSLNDPNRNKTLKERLEDMGLSTQDVLNRFEWMITRNAEIAIKSLEKMTELESNGSYAFDLLGTFDNAMTRYKLLKERSPDAFKFKIQGRELNNDELYSKALDYAIHSMNVITTLFKTYPMNAPEALQPTLFSDYGLESYGFLKDFIEKHGKNYVGLIKRNDGLVVPLSEKLKEDNETVEKEMESFAEFVGKRQQDMLDAASNSAKEGNSAYRHYLNKFKEITEKYSWILEEEDLDIARMQRVCDSERHIEANHNKDPSVYGFNGSNSSITDASYNKKLLPLYQIYKNLNGDASLPKIVLDVKKDYVKAKRESKEIK